MSKSFVSTIQEIREGGAVDELTDALANLVAAVRATGRKGKLTFTLTVKLAGKGDSNVLMLEDETKIAPPAIERGTSVFFATDDNVLQRNDPRQPELKGLRQVTQHPAAQPREAV